ncbi:MAG: hypothetical protein M1269_09000 [Chloroflexi bacterium]|nr:hypothetical protein [Chloroflexota bacterium]
MSSPINGIGGSTPVGTTQAGATQAGTAQAGTSQIGQAGTSKVCSAGSEESLKGISLKGIWDAIKAFIDRLRGKKPEEPGTEKPPGGSPGGDIPPNTPPNGSDPVASVNITDVQKKKAMTVMVYEDADSTGTSRLESYQKKGLVSDENTNVILMTQKDGVAKSYLIDKEGAHPIEGNFGVQEKVDPPQGSPSGTPNFAVRSKDNLQSFVTNSMHYFPSDKTVFVMSGQGTGTADTTGMMMTTFDGSFHKSSDVKVPAAGERTRAIFVTDALRKSTSESGRKIDLTVLDVDNMGELDMAAGLRGTTDEVVFSQRETKHQYKTDGYETAKMRDEVSLKEISNRLASGEKLSNEDMAKIVVSKSENPTTSAVNADATEALMGKVDNFSNAVINSSSADKIAVRDILAYSWTANDAVENRDCSLYDTGTINFNQDEPGKSVDLYAVAKRVAESKDIKDPAIKKAANEILGTEASTVDAVKINRGAGSEAEWVGRESDLNGISIPIRNDNELAVGQTSWSKMVRNLADTRSNMLEQALHDFTLFFQRQ